MSHTVMVRVADLEKLPEPVRRYFDDWGGRPKKILGVAVVSVDMMTSFSFEDWRRKKQGRGPGHTVDNHAYSVGDQSINEWMEKHPEIVEQIYGSEEHHECCDDDD